MMHLMRNATVSAGAGLLFCLLATTTVQASFICDVALHLDTSEPLTVVELRLDYGKAKGRFEKTNAIYDAVDGSLIKNVVCTSEVPRTSLIVKDSCSETRTDCDGDLRKKLSIVISNRHGMRGQQEMKEFLGHSELASCSFTVDNPSDAAGLVTKIVSAASTNADMRAPAIEPTITTHVTGCRPNTDSK